MLSDSIPKAERPQLSMGAWCLAAIWIVAVLAGFAVVINFDLTPGEAGTAPPLRPAAIESVRATDRPLLMVFAHPRCPCTRATLVELNHIITLCPGAADVRVLFRTPENPSAEWTKTGCCGKTPHCCPIRLPWQIRVELWPSDSRSKRRVTPYCMRRTGSCFFQGASRRRVAKREPIPGHALPSWPCSKAKPLPNPSLRSSDVLCSILRLPAKVKSHARRLELYRCD